MPPKALTDHLTLGATWISGGRSGRDFLVFACGLNQPCARRGVLINQEEFLS